MLTIEPPSFMKNPYKYTMMGCCHERYKVEPYNCIEVYHILLVVQSSNYQLQAYQNLEHCICVGQGMRRRRRMSVFDLITNHCIHQMRFLLVALVQLQGLCFGVFILHGCILTKQVFYLQKCIQSKTELSLASCGICWCMCMDSCCLGTHSSLEVYYPKEVVPVGP